MTILLPIYIALLVLVFITYKIKNTFIRWPCIVLPPLSLVILVWIPQDLITVVVWRPAQVAMLFSICSIVVNVVVAIIRRIRKQKAGGVSLVVRLIRPVMVVCIYFCVVSIVRLSIKSADIYAVQVGKQVQQSCDTNGLCPERIDGWDASVREGVQCEIWYGKYGTKYFLRYMISGEGKEFTILTKHNIDEAFYVTGGVNKNLAAEISVQGNGREIDVNELAPD